MPRELALTKIGDDVTLHQEYGCIHCKLRKYLKLDEDVEILNIHGEDLD
jgi:hypothetical protein